MLLKRMVEAAAAAQVIERLPVRVDLHIYQGDDFYLNLGIDDSQVAVDLTTYTPKSQIRTKPGAVEVVAEFDVTVKDATTLALHLPTEESAKLPQTSSWDVQITDVTGVVTTLAYGTVTANREVTT